MLMRIRFSYSNFPDIKGFSDKNLWRMKQFYETYAEDAEKLSPLVREIAPEAERVFRDQYVMGLSPERKQNQKTVFDVLS